MSMEREAKIQDALKDVIEGIIARKLKFNGLEITHVERDYPVDRREVDLALFTRPEKFFMFIETKPKGTDKDKGDKFSPLDRPALGQVLSYAAILKRNKGELVPFVAVANPSMITIFSTPEDIEKRVNFEAIDKRDYKHVLDAEGHRNLLENCMKECKEFDFHEEHIYSILSKLTQLYLEKKIIKEKPDKALILRMREFVSWIADRISPLLQLEVVKEQFKVELEKFGYRIDQENLPQTTRNLAKMMSYAFMNKIVLYKLLERIYKAPYLKSFDSSSLARFNGDVDYYFKKAIEITKDFEPIFSTGIYDKLPFPDDPELMEYINDFILTIDSVDIAKIGEQIGYIYEELIPPEERHQLGQFYTPPWVCKLITKWCIREQRDWILDPGVGSGGFILKAYDELRELKLGRREGTPEGTHERILNQLHAIDINSFPAQLSSIGLAMKNIRAPSTKTNVIVEDFFSIQLGQKTFLPYTVETVAGKLQRELVIPEMDVVIGNPPYTRWAEIPKKTQKQIKQCSKKYIKKYKLTPQTSRGVEPGIYTYWIMHATDFLKNGGRLGMIISNTWLQTDYGIKFGNFLLDHFRIRAIVDIALRLFKGALISTCIVLAEKESNKSRRLENEVAFIHIPGEVESKDVDELLKAVASSSEKYKVSLVKQSQIPRDQKWIDMLFKTADISGHPLIVKLGELFEPLRGNTVWAEWSLSHGKRPDPGSSEFHYLSPSKIKERKLDKWAYPEIPLKDALVYPTITSARQVNFFTFSKDDWEEMHRRDNRCYVFATHIEGGKLPKEVADYIEYGEKECRTRIRGTRGGGKLAGETEAAKVRAKETKHFHCWYDLGEIIQAPIFSIRQAWYKTRFTWCKFPVAMYDALIALIPKRDEPLLDETHIKAFLSYLNSSFTQNCIEKEGRKSPGGIIGFEVSGAREMPVLDVRKLNVEQLSLLAKLFDELELEARKIGGASTKEQIGKLKPKIYKIDKSIAKILDIKDEDIEDIEAKVDQMVERRTSAVK